MSVSSLEISAGQNYPVCPVNIVAYHGHPWPVKFFSQKIKCAWNRVFFVSENVAFIIVADV